MAIKAYLNSIEYYLPKKILSNDKINREHPEWSVDKISKKTGIKNRYIADVNEFSSDMALKAAAKLFEATGFDRNEIDYLILCTQSPDYLIPTTACIIQNKLGLKNDTGAIDINMGCSGYIYGLSYAKGLIYSQQAKNILFITSETYSKYIHQLDKSNKTIFGDGASASLISSQKTELSGEIKNFTFYTDGSGYDKLIVRNSGVKNDGVSQDIFDENQNFIRNDANLFMDGKAIFEFTSFKVPPIIKSVLTMNEESLDEIDLFVFHQANAYMMKFIRKFCNIPEERFFLYIEDCANTVSSTIPIALQEAIKSKRIKKGSKVLLAGYGVGLSIACTILNF